MPRSILRRTFDALILVGVVFLVTFVLLQLAPGDAASRYVGGDLDPAAAERVRRSLGLDASAPVRLVRWVTAFVRGDAGVSLVTGRPVMEMLAEALPRTLALVGAALVLQVVGGVVLGAFAAARAGSRSARLAMDAALFVHSTPSFAVAYLLLGVFALRLGWFPAGGAASLDAPASGAGAALDAMRHAALPVLALAAGGVGGWARFVRASVLDALGEPHVVALRARGASWRRAVWRHGLRGAAAPLVTLAGASVPALVGGAVVVETIFAWPGMGRLVVEAIARRDVPVVLAANVLAAVVTVAASTVVDLLEVRLDPRTELASAGDGIGPDGGGTG